MYGASKAKLFVIYICSAAMHGATLTIIGWHCVIIVVLLAQGLPVPNPTRARLRVAGAVAVPLTKTVLTAMFRAAQGASSSELVIKSYMHIQFP